MENKTEKEESKESGKKSSEERDKIKEYLGKFWYLVWKDESLIGWAVAIVVIFVLIKFIFFPLLSLATGTELPIAIVESCSMYHKGGSFSNFDNWWERHDDKYEELGINKTEFENFKMNDGFNKGDVLFITGTETEKLEAGDIIIFKAQKKHPIIHRVVNIEEKNGEKIFSTIGDNNARQIPSEKSIKEEQIIGEAQFTLVPYAGWVKLVFMEPFRAGNGKGFCEED